MSHKPPVPDASVAPYPPTPAPHDPNAAPDPQADATRSGSWIDKRVVAGIAVGSAAVAAALLFAGRTSRPKSAAIAPPPVPTPDPADASDIRIAQPREYTD